MTDPNTLPKRPPDSLRQQLQDTISATYELGDEIGRGGMGIVFRAQDLRLKRLVAVKLLPPDLAFREDIRSRFLREAQTSAQLSHPNIVPIHTVEDTGHFVYFVMGYVRGVNLAEYLRDTGVIEPSKVRDILREVAEALAYAHSRNVIHRDIKPDNILLDAETGRAMVTDFGIARAVHETSSTRLTTTGVAIGTPAYMSPEQSAGEREVDGRSDLYSLGVVGYQLVCGEPPFVAPNTPAMLVKHLSETPRSLVERCGAPDDLNEIIMRCLAKDPADRFADAKALIDALDGKALVGSGKGVVSQSTLWNATDGSDTTVEVTSPDLWTDPLPVLDRAFDRPPVPEFQMRAPQPVELARWHALPVQKYRRRIVTFLAVNVVFVILSVLGQHDAWWFSAFWAIWLAFGYSKLWAEGYDWRDVLKRPHDVLFADVIDETIDGTRALFDPAARERVRARARARIPEPRGVVDGGAVNSGAVASRGVASGVIAPESVGRTVVERGRKDESLPTRTSGLAELPAVQEAGRLRTEIVRMFYELPEYEREQLPDVVTTVEGLSTRIERLALAEHELETSIVPGVADATEQEIAQLENEANPLQEEESARRIRRLVQLRRQRVVLRDLRNRHEQTSEKLERCMHILRTMRLDFVRFRSGVMSPTSITQVASEAIQMGQEVDAMLYARDELTRVLRNPSRSL